ncbi:hypothetical protein E2W85_12730 [Salmonella enterica]|nr:hypothetical protein [Salmonella enterica]EEG9158468.1 hypothetical protein [Salmonella enterica]
MITVSQGSLGNPVVSQNQQAKPQPSPQQRPPLIPVVTTVGYNGRRGDGTLRSQGWTQRTGATFTATAQTDRHGGYYLNIVKNAGAIWEIKQPASLAPGDLIRYGGRIFCRFRLKGAVVNNRYAFAFYLRVSEAEIPAGVVLDGKVDGTGPAIAAFCVTTAGNKITLSQHRSGWSPIAALCDYGTFDNEWHTLEIIYPGGNSISVTPVLDGVPQTAVNLYYTSAAVPENTIDMMSITSGTVYEVDVSSFEGQIYRDNISKTLSEVDDRESIFIPPSYRTATLTIPDKPMPVGFSVSLHADNAELRIKPENASVLLQPPGADEAYPNEYVLTKSATLIQTDVFGKTWLMV